MELLPILRGAKRKNCLDNYYNQRNHDFFDRHVGLQLLDYRIHEYELFHSAHYRVKGKELVITNLADDKFKW